RPAAAGHASFARDKLGFVRTAMPDSPVTTPATNKSDPSAAGSSTAGGHGAAVNAAPATTDGCAAEHSAGTADGVLAYERINPDRAASSSPTESILEEQTPGSPRAHDPYVALRYRSFNL